MERNELKFAKYLGDLSDKIDKIWGFCVVCWMLNLLLGEKLFWIYSRLVYVGSLKIMGLGCCIAGFGDDDV